MNFNDAIPPLQAVNAHAVASEDTSIFEDIGSVVTHAPSFLAVSIASAANSFYNTGVTVGNVFSSEDNQTELRDTGEWISSYDEDLGKYYQENKSAADLAGFVAGSLIPGTGAVKGLNVAQKALRASEVGIFGSNMRWATNLLAPTMETYVKREAADLAAKSATFSFTNANSIKALASGTWQGVLEGAAFETAVAATMFKSPILDDMDFGDIVKNGLFGVGISGGIGAIGAAAGTYFGVGRLVRQADQRARPFMSGTMTSEARGTLASDPIVRAAADKELLQGTEVTAEYITAAKLGAGESGESLAPDVIALELGRLNRLKSDNIQRLDNEIRTSVRKMSSDDVLGNSFTDITAKMNSADTQRLFFNARGIVRAGDTSETERLAKELVKTGVAKDLKSATKSLEDSLIDTHVRIHSGQTGEIIAGKVGFLRLADRYNPEMLEKKIAANQFKPSEKLDYRTKLDPEKAELRWIASLSNDLPFPKGYVFNSHDLPALTKAQRLGMEDIKIDVGNGNTRTISKAELPEYIQLAKGEAIMAHRELGTKSDLLEMYTDVKKDWLEGVDLNGSIDDAFNAQASYARDYSSWLGRDDSNPISALSLYSIPRFAKVTYDTQKIMDDSGMIMKGMELIKHRQKLAKQATDNYFASYAGELSRVFPDIPEDVFRRAWRGEGGAGTFTNAGGAYGSIASMASYIGNLVGELSKLRIQAVTDDIASAAQGLLSNSDDAIRFSTINSIVSGTPEKYVLSESGDSLIPYKYKQYMDAGGEGDLPILHPGSPEEIPLESVALQEAVAKHIGIGDRRNAKWRALNAVQGNTDEKLAGTFRPIRPDPRDYKYVAFVKDETLVGVGHTTMLRASTGAELESMISKVNEIGKYKVYTKTQAEDFYRARGEYDYDKTLHENYIDTDLQSRGIMSNFLPHTDPQKVVNEWLQYHVRGENALLKQSVLIKYEKETNELKRLAEQWSQSQGSRIGTRSIDEVLTSSEKNPYTGILKSMLNVTKTEEMPAFLRTANQALDGYVSKAWDSAQRLFVGSKYTPENAEKINAIFDELGFKSAYYDTATQVLANSTVPRGTLTTFIRAANAFLTTTVLRLDAFNALNNLMGNTILYSGELKAVTNAIKQGSVEGAGDLAKLANIAVPGVDDVVFSPAKLLANSLQRLHGPDKDALLAEYKIRGLTPDLSDQYYKSLDAMTLTGMESVKDINSKISQIGEAWESFAKAGEKWTGNKWSEQFNRLLAVDAMKQITEVAVARGIMDEKAAWMYVNTFSNRVNGVIRAAERPLMFQGPIGQAIGLFQSYQINLMQQVFRHIGEGRGKTVALMAGLQGSIYGASSLPGFNLINSSLVGQASGNPEHYDLFSATQVLFGQKGSDWLMYGVPSNVLNAALYTRGDTNPRTWSIVPNPAHPEEIPFISSFAKAFGAIKTGVGNVQGGAPIWDSFLGAVEHLGISRPLAGIAQVARGATSPDLTVFSTQANGSISGSNDLFSLASLTRIAGAKPIDEAIITNSYFRINAYAQKDRERREALGTQLKGQLLGGQEISNEGLEQFAEKYVSMGGSATGFNQWWMSQYKNVNLTQAQQMVSKLDNPYARRMMEVMGGRNSLNDINSFYDFNPEGEQ